MKVSELRAALNQFSDEEEVLVSADCFYRRYRILDVRYSGDGRVCIGVSGREWQDYIPKTRKKKGTKSLLAEVMMLNDANRSLEEEKAKLSDANDFCAKRIRWLEDMNSQLRLRVHVADSILAAGDCDGTRDSTSNAQ